MIEIPSTPFLLNRYPSHVLFQLILSGFLDTQESVKILKKVSDQIAATEKMDQQNYEKLIQAIENLTGPCSPHRTPFPWNIKNGTLTKLKDGSSLFQTIYEDNYSEASVIKRQAIKSWLYGSELKDLAVHLSVKDPLKNSSVFNLFQKIEMQMIAALKLLGNVIAKALKHFKTNENVLYYLLCHQSKLDTIYGPSFTLKMFKQMYKNLNKLQDFLIKAYQQRGFEKLIPAITQKMSSLQCKL